jgi:hypothetical protein
LVEPEGRELLAIRIAILARETRVKNRNIIRVCACLTRISHSSKFNNSKHSLDTPEN